MCLAVPMQIIKIEDNTAFVSADGTGRKIRLDIIDERPEVGDYVIIHAGFALHRIDENTARENLKLLKEMLNHEISQ
jgi:hydrogenase expression/formation protein HypC